MSLRSFLGNPYEKTSIGPFKDMRPRLEVDYIAKWIVHIQ